MKTRKKTIKFLVILSVAIIALFLQNIVPRHELKAQKDDSFYQSQVMQERSSKNVKENCGLDLSLSKEEDLNNFDCYFSEDGLASQSKLATDFWTISDCLQRKGIGIATLLLKECRSANYELSVNYLSNAENFSLISKQSIAGVSSSVDGMGASISADGLVTLGGMSDISGKYGVTQNVSGYDKNEWHTLTLHVYNLIATLKLDKKEVATLTLPGFWETSVGYMGLQAQTDCKFKNFSVRSYDYFGDEMSVVPNDKQVKIACIGDSITVSAYGYDENGIYTQSKTFPSYLQKNLGNAARVTNYGVSGIKLVNRKNDGFVSQIEYTASLLEKPDIVLIMLGTNDILFSWSGASYAAEYKKEYIEMINCYKAVNAEVKIYVLSPPTYYGSGGGDAMYLSTLIPLQKEIANETGSTFFDMHTVTQNMRENYIEDGLHPNAMGCSVMADAIFEQIKSDFYKPFTMQKSINLLKGERIQLEVESYFIPQFVSSSTTVATVDFLGNVLANSVGKSVVTAKLGNNLVRCVITVKDMPIVDSVSCDALLKFGDPLPTLQFTANIAGKISLVAEQKLEVGTKNYDWIFTPTDDVNFTVVTGKILLVVEKAVPKITIPTLDGIVWRENGTLQELSLPQGFSFKNPNMLVCKGENIVTVLYMPTDSEHYETIECELKFYATFTEPIKEKGCKSKVSSLCLSMLLLGLFFNIRKAH